MDIKISIPDSYMERVLAAFEATSLTGDSVKVVKADIEEWLKSCLKAKVLEFELQKTLQKAREQQTKEQW